jgi:hypothetical protein
LLSDYFLDKSGKWERWWNENSTRTRISVDKELFPIVEEVYARGVETAYALGDILPKINSIKRCPRLKDYINSIRTIQKKWIPEDEKLLSRCEKIISDRKAHSNLDFSDIQNFERP